MGRKAIILMALSEMVIMIIARMALLMPVSILCPSLEPSVFNVSALEGLVLLFIAV
jgi:hypothetical protein